MTALSPWLTIAGVLCFGLAIIHSVLGERLIFKGWATDRLIPRSYAGIIRASWHALSLCGVGIGIVLWRVPLDGFTAGSLSIVFLASAMLIAIWTRFRHPGWIVMGLIGLLVLAARL